MTGPIRLIRIEGDVAYVPLTQGYEAIIDAADVPLVEGFNWCTTSTKSGKGGPYAQRHNTNRMRRTTVQMHREILGGIEELEVDHVDGNGLNNTRKNLRLATRAQNARNIGIPKHNTSGFKGVSYVAAYNKWTAQIKANGYKFHLGTYETAEAAHAAYMAASNILHGEFGRVA